MPCRFQLTPVLFPCAIDRYLKRIQRKGGGTAARYTSASPLREKVGASFFTIGTINQQVCYLRGITWLQSFLLFLCAVLACRGLPPIVSEPASPVSSNITGSCFCAIESDSFKVMPQIARMSQTTNEFWLKLLFKVKLYEADKLGSDSNGTDLR